MKSHLNLFIFGLISTHFACKQDVSISNKETEDCDAEVWYLDADGDGFGGSEAEASCDPLDGYVQNNSDCDDNNPGVNPAGTEICNTLDDDCNALIDDGVIGAETWYLDSDGDGFGDDSSRLESCEVLDGYVQKGGDCDDNNIQINPEATEVCDEIDNNCDSLIDDNLGDEFYIDSDNDGYGNADDSVIACEQPNGYADNDLDCDDSDGSLTLDCDVIDPVVTQSKCGGGTIYTSTGPSTTQPELHILSAYEPTSTGVINVQVDRETQMTLVLSSYEPVHWIVNQVPNAQIDKILLNGYHTQTITADPSIPVEVRSYDQTISNFGNWCGYSLPYNNGGCDTNLLLQGVTAYTGLGWTSFNGCYTVEEFLLE